MSIYDIITKKKRGLSLTSEEIRFFVSGYTEGSIPDYQISALLMAICLSGMDERETADLTDAIARSGDSVDLSDFGTLTVDKHSTGGVGDKTTLIIAPIAAALGCKVAKMSGRGLGHTGGTVDKLESISGYRTTLSPCEFKEQVERIGIAVIGQSGNLAPADKKLYALRDVTATVDSIPLICSSIMGKKLPSGSHSILLDVKCGSGAFMKNSSDARVLASEMVKIGKLCGRNTAAVITDMDTPLGCAIGNALEVREAVDVLRGGGPSDLRTVSLELAALMVHLALGTPLTDARALALEALDSGKAYGKFREWISAQGGDTESVLCGKANHSLTVLATSSGYISRTDAELIGTASVALGAGRAEKDDRIDMLAGIILHKKRGDKVDTGMPIATLYAECREKLSSGAEIFKSAFTISDTEPCRMPLIIGEPIL